MLDQPLASLRKLRVEFQTKEGPVVGVEDVSFDVHPGETVCIVGESGSGKSVSSLSLMRLVEFGGGQIAGGELLFNRGEGGTIDVTGKGLPGGGLAGFGSSGAAIDPFSKVLQIFSSFFGVPAGARLESFTCSAKGRPYILDRLAVFVEVTHRNFDRSINSKV